MNRDPGVGEALMADQAYDRLIGALRDGTLGAGQFVSMPGWSICSTCRSPPRARRLSALTSTGWSRCCPSAGCW